MTRQIELIAFGVLSVIAIILIIVFIKKVKKNHLEKEIDELHLRFNDLSTIPLSLRFSIAQAVAKRNDETDKEIKEYYIRYTKTQTLIDEINDTFLNVDDLMSRHKYGEVKKILIPLVKNVDGCEKEVKDTDQFLEKYALKETEQRSFSSNLKEEFQMVRDTIRKNAGHLSVAYDAIDEKLNNCSQMFTKSEDAMYANDYVTAQDVLEALQQEIINIKKTVNDIPLIAKNLVSDIPSSIDEIISKSALIRQRGVYLTHLDVDIIIDKAKNDITECKKFLSQLQIEGLTERVLNIKNGVEELNKTLDIENECYTRSKENITSISNQLIEYSNLLDYINVSSKNNDSIFYGIDKSQYDFDLFYNSLSKYKADFKDLSIRLANMSEPVSQIDNEITKVLNDISLKKDSLLEYKNKIDKNIGDVQRARAQLIKFQVIINQTEISVKSSHLPSISDSFAIDLNSCKLRISEIKNLLDESPIDIEKLNKKIDDDIDYIFSFSNDVKNLVGLSIMVENAIIFGNKFRSTHKEIDSDLSKSEFAFLNGEYTKAVQLAIDSMDYLYPNNYSSNTVSE